MGKWKTEKIHGQDVCETLAHKGPQGCRVLPENSRIHRMAFGKCPCRLWIELGLVRMLLLGTDRNHTQTSYTQKRISGPCNSKPIFDPGFRCGSFQVLINVIMNHPYSQTVFCFLGLNFYRGLSTQQQWWSQATLDLHGSYLRRGDTLLWAISSFEGFLIGPNWIMCPCLD